MKEDKILQEFLSLMYFSPIVSIMVFDEIKEGLDSKERDYFGYISKGQVEIEAIYYEEKVLEDLERKTIYLDLQSEGELDGYGIVDFCSIYQGNPAFHSYRLLFTKGRGRELSWYDLTSNLINLLSTDFLSDQDRQHIGRFLNLIREDYIYLNPLLKMNIE